MTDAVINHIVNQAPAPGHRITFHRGSTSQSIDLAELHVAAGRVARWLTSLGIRPGDRIGILADNCLEWVLLDLAALRLKAVTAGFEPGKFTADGDVVARYDIALLFTDRPGSGSRVRPITEVAAASSGPDETALPDAVYSRDDIVTIKFTSGSTGTPKGLAARVGSIDSSIDAVQQAFRHGPGDDVFVFLPLSLLQQRYWVYSALRYGHDVTVSTYESAFAALRRARPTVVMGVPAFFDIARRIIESRAERITSATTREAALRDVARQVFGDRIRYLWTGSAPAPATVLRFFTDVALPIYEGYGLNETCIVSKNHPGAHREGSVGRVLPGKEVLLDQDGVISVRSAEPVNTGYAYAPPGESERVFPEYGVVRTGDLGYIDPDGYLYIRGRVDDVIVLDDARKIIVRPIEELMRESPVIGECVVYCPERTHLVAVVSPATDPADDEAISAHLERANALLAPDEQIRRVVVAREPFSIDNGLLTSQFKPQRKRIFEAYRREIHDLEGKTHAR